MFHIQRYQEQGITNLKIDVDLVNKPKSLV
jgi:hypothetical protein